MTLGEALVEYRRAQVGTVAPATVKWYERRLNALCELEKEELGQVTTAQLRSVWVTLATRQERYPQGRRPTIEGGLSPMTLDGYIRAWRAFWNWAIEQGYTQLNPARKLKRPPVPIEPRRGIDFDDMMRLVEAASPNARDFAIMMFLADTACRAGGVAGLRKSDLEMRLNRATVREKGRGGENKARTVYFKETTRAALKKWLRVRPIINHDFVFVNEKRPYRRLKTTGIYQIIERYAKKIGLTELGWNPHNWRHGHARAMLRRGANLAQVQQLLGHTDPGVTARFYGSFVDEELQHAHRKYSWLPDDPPSGAGDS